MKLGHSFIGNVVPNIQLGRSATRQSHRPAFAGENMDAWRMANRVHRQKSTVNQFSTVHGHFRHIE